MDLMDKDSLEIIKTALHISSPETIDELIQDKRTIITCPYPHKTCKKQFHSTTWTGEFKGEKHYRCTDFAIVERDIKRHCGLP
jgi:hypothetical protein